MNAADGHGPYPLGDQAQEAANTPTKHPHNALHC
jgi:hypothetical protein